MASIVSQAHRWLLLFHIANFARTQQYSLHIIQDFVVHHNSCPKTYHTLCISASKTMFLVFLKHDICIQSVSLTWLHHWLFFPKRSAMVSWSQKRVCSLTHNHIVMYACCQVVNILYQVRLGQQEHLCSGDRYDVSSAHYLFLRHCVFDLAWQ